MDVLVILSGITTLIVSLFLGIFVLFTGYNLFAKFTRNIKEESELKNNNIAVAIIAGSFIFSLGFVLKSSIHPLVQSFFRIIFYGDQGWGLVIINLLILILQFILALLLAIMTLWIGLRVFTKLNRSIDEFDQIKNNNIAVGIFTAVVLITLSLFIEEGVQKLLQVIIFQPDINNSGLNPFG